MINFYSANTRNLNKSQRLLARSLTFTLFVENGLSYAIKWYSQLEKPDDMDFEDIPTHVSIGRISAGKKDIIFQSQVVQHISEWDNPHYSFIYYKDGQPFYDEDVFWEHVEDNENKPYAFMQLLFFVYRYIMKKYFNKKVKKNWFPANQVCSEHGYNDLRRHHDKHKLFKFSILKLVQYNSNTFSPMDCYNVCRFAYLHNEGTFDNYFKEV